MANKRQSAKRVRQADKRRTRNVVVRSQTKTTVKKALDAIAKKDLEAAKTAYQEAVRTLAKAGSRGAMPRNRAARKISRLTLLLKKTLNQTRPNA